ncbi:hypothetical protein [Leifsonia poae]|uniref:hypothetical protein n=1 Tax=Leifsonia poae TaxID=110933 RepID=UPI001CBD07AC|nr:hypothetical protein [Leifsonia poae]
MTTSPDLASLVASVTVREADGSSWYDLSSHPVSVDAIGGAIADRVRDAGITAVISWWTPDEAVLAHVVASALGVPRSSAELELGLITLSPELNANNGRRVLLVATDFDFNKPQEPLRVLLEGRGQALVATASFSEPEGIRFTGLD